ncbi:MAG: hypothetical protein D4S01_04370 [Dehalococcoidia bacterium]|nr:MAG: hypothetical protein D4S01_04370 [Dehalococcoidia bacterium]
MRIAINGNAVFPRRGAPPECPVGFANTIDPYEFEPIRSVCPHREIKTIPSGCCGQTVRVYCHVTGRGEHIQIIDCDKCREQR